MKRLLPLVLFVMSCRPCQQTGTVTPQSGSCVNGTSTCLNGHPYVCGGNLWRPVGTVGSCSASGGVCCLDPATGVHACLPQDRCAPTTSGGN